MALGGSKGAGSRNFLTTGQVGKQSEPTFYRTGRSTLQGAVQFQQGVEVGLE